MFHTQLMCSTGAVQVGVERQEELPSGQVPQLAARAQRGTDHVCHAQDWPHGAIHERSRGTSTLLRSMCGWNWNTSQLHTICNFNTFRLYILLLLSLLLQYNIIRIH